MSKYPAFPSILASQWPERQAEGWRFLKTCEPEECRGIYEQLCCEYGESSVGIGHWWDEDAMEPRPHPDLFSIYVRDTEDQVREFNHRMEAALGDQDVLGGSGPDEDYSGDIRRGFGI